MKTFNVVSKQKLLFFDLILILRNVYKNDFTNFFAQLFFGAEIQLVFELYAGLVCYRSFNAHLKSFLYYFRLRRSGKDPEYCLLCLRSNFRKERK